VLLWTIAIGAFFKFVLQEGIARWQLATGMTVVEGWAEYLPSWVRVYFGLYLVLWTVAVSAALTNATGLGISNLTGGVIPQSWGAVAHSLIGGLLIFAGGYNNFEKLMKVLVGIMGFSILICAGFTLHQPLTALQGLLIPTIPPGSGTYVLSLIGNSEDLDIDPRGEPLRILRETCRRLTERLRDAPPSADAPPPKPARQKRATRASRD